MDEEENLHGDLDGPVAEGVDDAVPDPVAEEAPAGRRDRDVDGEQDRHGQHHRLRELVLLLHVRLDGGEGRGSGEGEHYRAERCKYFWYSKSIYAKIISNETEAKILSPHLFQSPALLWGLVCARASLHSNLCRDNCRGQPHPGPPAARSSYLHQPSSPSSPP